MEKEAKTVLAAGAVNSTIRDVSAGEVEEMGDFETL